MVKDGFTTKAQVLEDIDQLIHTLNKIDKQVQVEINEHLNEGESQLVEHMKRLESDVLSLRSLYRKQSFENSTKAKKDHSYHLTLSY
ncbi:hypothetical protein [Ferdinandcohnia sp. Marseille-Q9671]